MRTNRLRMLATLASAAGLVLVFAGSAMGTGSSGIISGPILARGSFVGDVDVKFKLQRDGHTVVANAPSGGEVVVQEITIAPGGTTGWHSHPGPVVVVVKAGTLTFVRDADGECTSTPYGMGSAFVDSGQGHAHTAYNLGSDNLIIVATYFDVPAGTSPRIDVATVPAACS